MPITDFLLGSDPEVMLIDKDGNLISAIPVIPGTKNAPHQVPNGAIQHDNVNLEFGITPAASEDEWVAKHRDVLAFCANFLNPSDLKMLVRASADFPDSELSLAEARVFGCDPDFDPYTMSINSVPPGASESNLRTCGGHVHIGNKDIAEDIDVQAKMARVMDIFLGIPSLLLDKDPTSPRRRQLYGKAGAHRPKSYGVEYRSIGNFWVSHPNLARLVYRLVRDGLAAADKGHTDGINGKMVRSIINKNMMDKVETAMKDFVIPLLATDTRSLLIEMLEMPQVDIYKGWNL
jgi:hypothetical protein